MLDHQVLLNKLEIYGIRGIANTWFASYLHNRSLKAKVTTKPGEVTYSSTFNITYGTAQGSCLGSLLFIVFCNDVQLLPLFGSLILFADDTTLTNSHQSEKFLQYAIIHDMGLLIDWFDANKLSLNLNKTVMIQFWPTKTKLRIEVEGIDIPLVSSTKFLGVIVDDNLSWNEQVLEIESKINTIKHLLRTTKHLLPSRCLWSIYCSHIHSHDTSTKNIKLLSKAQNSCVHIMTGKSNLQAIQEDYKKLRILKIEDMIWLQYHQQKLPKPPLDMLNARGGKKTHRYPTRGKTTTNVQNHTSELFNRSFLCKSIVEYSKLSDKEKGCKSIKLLDLVLKCKNFLI